MADSLTRLTSSLSLSAERNLLHVGEPGFLSGTPLQRKHFSGSSRKQRCLEIRHVSAVTEPHVSIGYAPRYSQTPDSSSGSYRSLPAPPEPTRVPAGKYSYELETLMNQLNTSPPRASISRTMEPYKGKLTMQDFSLIFCEFGLQGECQWALRLFKYMQRQSWCSPNEHIYTILIGMKGREGDLTKASELFGEMYEHGVPWNLYSFTALINAYGRNGKIATMACIVNGPGERADADCGYVGGAPCKIDVYVGKEVVQRAIPMDGATNALVELVSEHGRWVDPTSEGWA